MSLSVPLLASLASSRNSSTMERGKVEIGAEILLRISRELMKSAEWLLTGDG
jgi:hypothetical protein